ncbi:MAG: tetratricopeptide repeat protein [Lachnospiraceae bacterium]|nr:tetratricopeptide repeat protein [Lachnospiraceae bacterium]
MNRRLIWFRNNMTFMKYSRKTVLTLTAVLLIGILLAGCSGSEPKAAFEEAQTALAERRYSDAITGFEAVIAQDRYLAESYRGLGIALLQQTSYAEAAIAFNKSILNSEGQKDEFLRDVNKYLAYCRLKQGRVSEAKEMYAELIAAQEEPDILYMMGRIKMSEGDTQGAGEDFSSAAALSTDYNMYISIYELYKEHKMDANGADFLQRALDMARTQESDHYGMGVIQYYLQNYEEAKAELIEDLRQNQNDERAVLLLGKTYLAMADAANARAMYREYLDNPNCAAASYNGLAMCDLQEKNYRSALQNIKDGLACNDDTIMESLLYNEIIVYEHMQDWTTAKVKAAAFAATFPTNEAGQRENAFLSTR